MSGNIAADTNAVIAYREGLLEVRDILESAEIIFLPAPVYGELLYGAQNSRKKEENVKAVNDFMDLSVFMPITEETVQTYAKIRTALRKKGRPIPENDIWIAAICCQLNIPLLSLDKHFSEIPNMQIKTW